VLLAAGACTASEAAMTPERAQATVTAFAVQGTAAALARAANEQAQASATAAARLAQEATATAVAEATASAQAAAATATATAQAAASTATALARPTATNTPIPTATPTPGPRFPAAVGGQGEVQVGGRTANFGFGVGRRQEGEIEGWLQYGSALGTLQATQFTRLDTHLGAAGFWGFGTLPDVEGRVSFNVNIVSTGQGGGSGRFTIAVYRPDGRILLSEGGAVVRGVINVNGP
jgi:hypothetical protein